MPLGRSAWYYVAGFALGLTPGKAGETIRCAYLRSHGVPLAAGLAAFAVERPSDFLVMALLATLALGAFSGVLGGVSAAVAAAGGLALMALLVLRRPSVRRRLDGALRRLVPGWRQRIGHNLRHAAAAASALTGAAPLSGGLLVGIAAWAVQGSVFFLLATSAGLAIALPTALGLYAVSLLIGTLSFLPGGIGSSDASMGVLLVAAGAEPGAAVAITVAFRAATLWLSISLGAAALAALHASWPTRAD